MSTWDEKAAKAAVESRHAIYDGDFWGYSDQSDAQDDGFENGARWQREALLSDDAVERAARELCAAAGENPDSNELWDEEPPWMDYTDEARAALAAALGEDER